jgi:hypothetical protein
VSTKLLGHAEQTRVCFLEGGISSGSSHCLLASATENGKFVTESNAINIFFVIGLFFLCILFPDGGVISGWIAGKKGSCSINTRLDCPLVPVILGVSANGSTGMFFSDDVIFDQRKKGLFQLLVSLGGMDGLAVIGR